MAEVMSENPTPEAVAAIVKGLSKAQREVLLKLTGGRRRATDFSGVVAAALRFPTAKRPALTDRDMTRNHGRRTAWYFLTADGLAVRQALTGEPK